MSGFFGPWQNGGEYHAAGLLLPTDPRVCHSPGVGSEGSSADVVMVPVELARLVLYDNAEQQFIYLREVGGQRGFPIVIGEAEANEIRRVVTGQKTERPLTHQLAYQAIRQLGHDLLRVDIVDLRNNTFFAQLVLRDAAGSVAAVLDARPSDALALALRANCQVRVAESVLASLKPDQGPDLPDVEPKADDEPEANE